MEHIKVLLIEDNPGDARLIKEMLMEAGNISFDLEWRDRLSAGLERLAEGGIDVVLLDLMLPDSRGSETFDRTLAQAPEVPIVVMTGIDDETLATSAVQKGAQDYLIKGQVDSNLLVRSIRYAIARKQAEEALKKYAVKLEGANRLKDLFTDIMRHDLMNPASIIKTMAELKLEETEDEGMRKAFLMIGRNADKLIDMIRSASMYARLESAEKLERQTLDLNEVFRAAIDSFKPELEKKNMRLEYLPEGRYPALVNPVIENVFSNLISNAIKYSPQERKIEVNITDENKHYRIYVKDWGYGIKDEDKGKLFTRFQRVDKKGVKGTGLGLAIVKRIVELHGGRVWVEDNPEGGSIFYVEIPKS
ncbi:MAG: ATP-binding protein [Candidatus Methanoperedens sp.]|nr:ATP-binding protein [Candidatus Methanoperedens sp.]